MIKSVRYLTLLGVSLTVLTMTPLSALLHAEEAAKKGVIAKRTEVMKLMAGKMETIHDMLDGALYFKSDVFSHAVKELKESSGSHLTALFPKGSLNDKSRAKPQIWKDFSSFEAYAKSLHTAAEGLEKTSAIAIQNGHIIKAQKQMTRGSYSDLNPEEKAKSMADMKTMQQSFLVIAKSCKGCHEKFQKPKKKEAKAQ